MIDENIYDRGELVYIMNVETGEKVYDKMFVVQDYFMMGNPAQFYYTLEGMDTLICHEDSLEYALGLDEWTEEFMAENDDYDKVRELAEQQDGMFLHECEFTIDDIIADKRKDEGYMRIKSYRISTVCNEDGCTSETFYMVERLFDKAFFEINEKDCRLIAEGFTREFYDILRNEVARMDLLGKKTILEKKEEEKWINDILDHYNSLLKMFEITGDKEYQKTANRLMGQLKRGSKNIDLSKYNVYLNKENLID